MRPSEFSSGFSATSRIRHPIRTNKTTTTTADGLRPSRFCRLTRLFDLVNQSPESGGTLWQKLLGITLRLTQLRSSFLLGNLLCLTRAPPARTNSLCSGWR